MSQKTLGLRNFDDGDWRDSFELTLMSAVRLARAVLPGMASRGWGRVVFVTSVSVKEPIEALVLSNTMRRGVTGLSKTLSNRYASEGVTVNCAMPGYTLTQRMEDLFSGAAEERGITLEEKLEEVAEDIPAGRLGGAGGVRRTRRIPGVGEGLLRQRGSGAGRRRARGHAAVIMNTSNQNWPKILNKSGSIHSSR